MTIPQEWIERAMHDDAYIFTEKWAKRLRVDRDWLYGIIIRVGLKANWMGPYGDAKRGWYFGLMFYWFGIFFNWKYHPDNQHRITQQESIGFSIWWKPNPFMPGVEFWAKRKLLLWR